MSESSLPYTDTKKQGAPGFYSGINAAFRYLVETQGVPVWHRYLEEMGRGYFGKCNRFWAEGGLPAVARYWRDFFASEPEAVVEVEQRTDRVIVEVIECPAIKHLRSKKSMIMKEYCQHCYILGQARANEAGMSMRLRGGDGSCRHSYARANTPLPPQDMAQIAEVS